MSEPAPTARDLAYAAEQLVRQEDAALARTDDPTGKDVAETELQAALALHDEVMEAVAPARA